MPILLLYPQLKPSSTGHREKEYEAGARKPGQNLGCDPGCQASYFNSLNVFHQVQNECDTTKGRVSSMKTLEEGGVHILPASSPSASLTLLMSITLFGTSVSFHFPAHLLARNVPLRDSVVIVEKNTIQEAVPPYLWELCSKNPAGD